MIALRNLQRNKLRTLLTLLGVAAGISVFVSSLSISSGFKSQLQDIIKNYSIDITVQSKGAATPAYSEINISDYNELHNIEGVKDTSSLIIGSINTPWNPYFLIAGLSSVEALSGKFGIVEGRPFTAGHNEIMLGELAAKHLKYNINNKIVLADKEIFLITGIYSLGSRIPDGGAVLDLKDAQRLLKKGDKINLAFINIKSEARPQDVIERIHKRFPHLSAVLSGDFIGQIRLFKAIDLFVWAVSVISVFTCGLVVMNTFFMAIAERTREIGIMLAIGWTRFMIFRIILYEAICLSFTGALFGNLLAILLLNILNNTNTLGLGWLPSVVPAAVVLKSLYLSVILGSLGSAWPAFLASRLLPVKALRHE